MLRKHAGDEVIPLRGHGETFPGFDLIGRMQCLKAVKFMEQRVAVVDKVIVLFSQERRSKRRRRDHLKTGAGPHLFDESLWHTQVADFLAFCFHVHGAYCVES